MAAPRRNNSPARWSVFVASALAAAGFWIGIVNGPQPAQGGSSQMVVSGPASGQALPQDQLSRRGAGSSFAPQPQFSAPAPRFRTRGS